MDWQLAVVLLIVGVSAAYLARQTWRAWTGQKGCKTGCGCGPKTAAEPPLIRSEELTIRPR